MPAQDLAAADKFGRIKMAASARFELSDPGLEDACGEIKHVEQGRRHVTCLVQNLLYRPGGFAQIRQADHAAAALQGMEAATYVGERVLFCGRGMHQRQVLVDVGQDLSCFLEENGEQFRVDTFPGGIRQGRVFCRRDLVRHQLRCGQGRRRGGRRFQFQVRHQIDRRGFFLRRRFRLRGRGDGFFFPGCRCCRDQRRLSRLSRLVCCRLRVQEVVYVGCTALQLGDEKSQCREFLRHIFEVAALRREAGVGKILDSLCAFAKYGIGTVMTEHQQRALNLANRLLERSQSCLARRVAEEVVQRLFYDAEIGADFTRHRFQQMPFLGTARHRIKMRHLQHVEFLAAPQCGEAPDHGIGRARKVGIQRLEVLQCGLRQQQCRGHLQPHHFIVSCRIPAQPVGLFENDRGQPGKVGLSGSGSLFGDFCRAFVERRQCGSGAGAKAVPVILGGRQQFTQTAQMGPQPVGFGRRRRHHAGQSIGGAHNGQCFAAGGGAGGLVERLAQ